MFRSSDYVLILLGRGFFSGDLEDFACAGNSNSLASRSPKIYNKPINWNDLISNSKYATGLI